MQILTLIQTCSESPSQWEGKLEDGRQIYIRYRWGELTIDLIQDSKETNLLTEQLGSEYDGSLPEKKLRKILSKHGFKF